MTLTLTDWLVIAGHPQAVQGLILRAKGDTGPLDVTVKFMNCNDKTCLPPETVPLTVP